MGKPAGQQQAIDQRAIGQIHIRQNALISIRCFHIEFKADAFGKMLQEVFCASVYIISPLRFVQDICEKIVFFHEHGLRVRIGNYMSMGGTGPSRWPDAWP